MVLKSGGGGGGWLLGFILQPGDLRVIGLAVIPANRNHAAGREG